MQVHDCGPKESDGSTTNRALAIALPRATIYAVETADQRLAYVERLTDGPDTLRLAGAAVSALLAVLLPLALAVDEIAPIDTPAWPVVDTSGAAP